MHYSTKYKITSHLTPPSLELIACEGIALFIIIWSFPCGQRLEGVPYPPQQPGSARTALQIHE
jgi:hypothetical protein